MNSIIQSGKKVNSKQRLLNRAFIMSNLEYIIKESIYYRSHSEEFETFDSVPIGAIDQCELKAKIL